MRRIRNGRDGRGRAPAAHVKAVSIGDVEFDPDTGELAKDRTARRLRPQTAAVLELLASRPGQLVSRGELRSLLWPGAPGAADAALNTCVSEIRTALEDLSAGPDRLETIPRRGYRLSADGDGPPVARSWVPRESSPWMRGVTGVLVAIAILMSGSPPPEHEQAASHSGLLASLAEAEALLRMPRFTAWQEGAEILDSVVDERPDYAPALAAAALARFRLQDESGSRALARRAIRADPLLPEAHLASGLVALYWDHDPREGERALTTSLRLRADDPSARIAMGYWATIAGREDDPVLADALSARPTSPSLALEAAYLHYLRQSYAAMLELCEQARRPGGEGAASRCSVDAYLALGDLEAAARAARRVVHAPSTADPDAVLRRFWTSELTRARHMEVRGRDPGLLAFKALSYLGRREAALRALAEAKEKGVRSLAHLPHLPYAMVEAATPD